MSDDVVIIVKVKYAISLKRLQGKKVTGEMLMRFTYIYTASFFTNAAMARITGPNMEKT